MNGFHHLELIVEARLPSDGTALVSELRLCSKEFRFALGQNDTATQGRTSKRALEIFVAMFDHWRNEQDYGAISTAKMSVPAGKIVRNVDGTTRDLLVSASRLGKKRLPTQSLSLRNSLNKLAHMQRGKASYRITRKHHIMIVSGLEQGSNTKYWVAEIEIGKLCRLAQDAL